MVRLRRRVRRRVDAGARCAQLYAELPFFRSLVDNLEMTLAKSSLEIAREYLELVPPELEPGAAVRGSRPSTTLARSTRCSRSWSADALLERQPVLRRSIDLRNPYVDPMNAIQVELLAPLPRGRRVGAAAADALDRRDRGGAQEHRVKLASVSR